MEDYLKNLNKKQYEAVLSKSKQTLVLAGAGTGKTSVLTSRIAYLLDLGLEPREIFAVTFTNKAAKSMKERIEKIVSKLETEQPIYINDITIGTFHGICNRLLKRNAEYAGLNKDFTVIDDKEQSALIEEVILTQTNIIDKSLPKKEQNAEVKKVVGLSVSKINSLKDEAITVSNYNFTNEDYAYFGFNMKEIYEKYEEEKEKIKSLDFGDLILRTVELLKGNRKIKEYYNEIYRHILVDEFQDTNTAQSLLIELLYNKESNYLFVVGDDDQSIYEWRGANIRNILDFDKKYDDVLTVRLEQNYRSTNNILNCANNLIKNNKNRKGKNLWSDKSDGNKVEVFRTENGFDEANRVAKIIKSAQKRGENLNDFAILYRTNYISRMIEHELNKEQIPYTIINGLGFWSRQEIKDMISYLTLIVNPQNNLAFDRAIKIPKRGFGDAALKKINKYAQDKNVSRFYALKKNIDTKLLSPKLREEAKSFVNLIDEASHSKKTLSEKIEYLMIKSGLVEYYMEKDGEEKGQERAENINELISAAESFKNENPKDESDELAFINYAVLQSAADKETDGSSVQMMTVHASKGLEFPNVFLMAWEDGVFPSESSIREGKVEEERRLAYVAITRAEKELWISSCEDRGRGTIRPESRFISELPEELINKQFIKKGFNPQNSFYSGNQTNTSWQKPKLPNGLKIGSKYTHSKFGEGKIITIIPTGENYLVKVDFGLIGIKNLFFEKNNK